MLPKVQLSAAANEAAKISKCHQICLGITISDLKPDYSGMQRERRVVEARTSKEVEVFLLKESRSGGTCLKSQHYGKLRQEVSKFELGK